MKRIIFSVLSLGMLMPLGTSANAYPYNNNNIYQTGPNSYSNWGGTNTYSPVPGVKSPPLNNKWNGSGTGWVQNDTTGGYHMCTSQGFCTD